MDSNIVLVVASHPDDEILGCGGSIARHVKQGDNVHVVILAEGITSRDNTTQKENKLSALALAAKKANQIVGSTSLVLMGYPDNRMDSLDRLEVIKVIENYIKQYNPSIIYTHHAGDLNVDHQITHQAVVTACRPFPGSRIRTLLFFEVSSSTDWQVPNSLIPFTPNWFVDISETLEQKIEALKAYETEMRDWPHSRSIKAVEHLARYRGGGMGRNAVEAFMLGRHIESFL